MEVRVPEWFIVFIVVAVGLTPVFSLNQTPTYEATVKMLVSQKADDWYPLRPWEGGGLQEVTLTVARAVDTAPVAQGVVEQLNQPELSAGEVLANMSVEPDPGTMFINVSYQDSDPQRAQLIVNTIGEVSSQKVADVKPDSYPIIARVWKPATLPKAPVSPKPIRNTILALGLGLTVYVGWAFARPRIAASIVGQTNRAMMGE